MPASAPPLRGPRRATRGFSLVELLVAMAMFLIVAGAAFSLFNSHVQMVTRQQTLSGVNIGLRNAMSQLELDLSGAGQNLLAGDVTSGQSFSLGVIINNNVPGVAPACAPNTANWSYPTQSACFDSLTVINLKPCTLAGGTYAPVLVIDDPGNAQESLSTSSIMWGDDPNNPDNVATLTNDVSCFKSGDELLVVQIPNNGQQQAPCDNGPFNYCIAVVTLTQDAQVSGTKIQLQHNPTGASSDPLGIVYSPAGTLNFKNALASGFTNGAYIIDLGSGANAVTYAVQANPANPSDPQLMRCTGAVCNGTNGQVLTDQVIGFKVGAALWDNAKSTDLASYFYDATLYCNGGIQVSGTYVDCTATPPAAYDPYNYTLVRSIRISMIGRTPPNADMTLAKFKNGFDGGPYLVQQGAIVVDLRNLSNADSTN